MPGDWGRCVVTIGVFDGVHRGHRRVINSALERAREADLPAVAITFDPNPAAVVRPGTEPPVLTTVETRARLLGDLGVDTVLVLPFTKELSQLSPEDFVRTVLVNRLHAAAVVVGENFRFGHKAAGDPTVLAELGPRYSFAVEPVALAGAGDIIYSSTRVREDVESGDVEAASRILDRPHLVEGVVVRGDGRGRAMGYPTANLDCPRGTVIPADGVYAGWLACGDERWPAAISVGTNPTFDGTRCRVEAYALDRDDLDLYDRHVAVEFIRRLRDTRRFASADELVTEMDKDVQRTRASLAGASESAGSR